MEWFVCLDGHSSRHYIEMGLVAIESARVRASIRPTLVFDGPLDTPWLDRFRDMGVPVVQHSFEFYPEIERINGPGAGCLKGAFLRCDLWKIVKEPYYLYTDLDIVFLAGIDELASMKPELVCAVSEQLQAEPVSFYSGLMVVNSREAERLHSRMGDLLRSSTLDDFAGRRRLEDQVLLNCVYRGAWKPIAPEFDWLTFWGPNENARVVHWCGIKPFELWAMKTSGASTEQIEKRLTRPIAVFDESLSQWDVVAGPLGIGVESWSRNLNLEEFDEQGYLAANPDVKAAVDAGGFYNGLYHYLMFGRYENRKLKPSQETCVIQ